MRKICKDKNRAKAFEEHYKYETPLTGGNKHLDCAIVRGEIHLKLHYQCYISLQFLAPQDALEVILVTYLLTQC